MKKNPGRRMRRQMFFATRSDIGRRRAKLHDHIMHQKAMKGEV